jgi:hypothetical protein
MWNWLYNILVWIDEGGNAVIIGFIGLFIKIPVPAEGNSHYTISQVMAELRERNERVGCVGCKILTWMFKPFFRSVPNYDHCTEAMKGMPEDVDNA